ncbi:MAG: ATP-binding protein [Anaerolineaceae bacterium]|nr:ATP-binding protein [Anaerolineaceae bacterium]
MEKIIDKTKTNPGFNKQFKLKKFPVEEQNILKKLSKEWYITNSGEEFKLGNSIFRYFLMKPTQLFTEMFNIDRELICVFSPYNNFEPRTLDAFDYVSTKMQNLRIENACKILISNDDSVEETIASLLKSDPEQPIVIPFSYNELNQNYDDFFLRNRFRRHFYTRDLFSFLSPLKKDLYFFGRSELIQEIINQHRSGEHSALFGLRKSGKTSIVYAIERSMTLQGGKTIVIDCESPSIHKLRWNELLQYLTELFKEKHNSEIKLGIKQKYYEKKATRTFEADIIKIYNEKKQSTLLIFDEIERISPMTGSSDHWRSGDDFILFWQSLRYFFQRNTNVLTYMLVGTNPNSVESATFFGHDNPLFSSIPFQFVPSFTISKAREMVRKLGRYMGLKFDEIIFSKLTDDFGGHPFLIRQICSVINSMCIGDRPVRVDKQLYKKAKSEFLFRSKHYVEMIVQVLQEWYPNEYDMLVLLAQNEIALFNDLAQDSNYYTNHLIGYGLISVSENGFAFNIECIKDYLLQKHRYSEKNLTYEQKASEVLERRTKLEQSLRKIIHNQLIAVFGKKVAFQKILSASTEKRREALSDKDMKSLFMSDSSPLYFLELINIINREWEIYKNIFEQEKNRLLFILNEINSFRKDAHSNNLNDDEFTQLRLHLKSIEGILSDWI